MENCAGLMQVMEVMLLVEDVDDEKELRSNARVWRETE
jgi:hypothetical protein